MTKNSNTIILPIIVYLLYDLEHRKMKRLSKPGTQSNKCQIKVYLHILIIFTSSLHEIQI